MERVSVLLVDLESPYDTAFAARCAGAKFRPVPAHGALPPLVSMSDFALCVVAISGRSESSIERIRALTKLQGNCPVVVLAKNTGIDFAIRLIRFGVADVIELPAAPMEAAARAFNWIRPGSGNSDLRLDFVGQSSEMAEVRKRVANAARVTSTVLIQGETGTGKGVVARLIHDGSERRDQPFVHVDCGALAANLIESELFGHERGAFTGASSLRRGRFETAEAGTVFLDEIGELTLQLQAKLLRVLEERSFERVGGSSPLRLHARIIAATNRNLREGVRGGTFRPDLFYRLNVLSIEVPSLRDRPTDVPLLVEAGLRRICEMHGVTVPPVSDSVLRVLSAHDWPGNVRELLNLLERLAIEARPALWEVDELRPFLMADSPEASPQPIEGYERFEPHELREAQKVRDALLATGGNLSRTARRLEIPRSTLRHKMTKYRLNDLIPKD